MGQFHPVLSQKISFQKILRKNKEVRTFYPFEDFFYLNLCNKNIKILQLYYPLNLNSDYFTKFSLIFYYNFIWDKFLYNSLYPWKNPAPSRREVQHKIRFTFNPEEKVIDTIIVESDEIQVFVFIHYRRKMSMNFWK